MKEQKGFSLLELIISCTMLGFVILGVAMIYPAATESVTRSRTYTRAINLAQARIQDFERIIPNTLDTLQIRAGNHGPETIDIYTRRWVVTVNSPLPRMRTIRMTVSWNTGASADSVVLVTYIDL